MTTDDGARRAQRLFAEAQALMHVGVWEFDTSTEQVFWSDELFQIFGLVPDEVAPTFEEFLARVANARPPVSNSGSCAPAARSGRFRAGCTPSMTAPAH